MNIGIVTAWFERGAGYVSKQFEEILQKKHNVYIYARGGEKYAKGDPNWDRPNVCWGKRINSPFVSTVIHKKDFLDWIDKNRIDIIIFNEQHWFQPLLWCKEKKIRTIAYVDYYNEETIPLFNVYDALICNTRRHQEAFSEHPHSYYIPWGTNVELFSPSSNSFSLVSPGIVTFFHSSGMNGRRKGTDLFLKALMRVKGDFKAVIHTQKDLAKQFPDLEEAITSLKKENKLQIINRTCSAPGLYHLGDVYVYPSRLEGIGLTIAESISCGLVCIVPDNPPMNEFVDEKFARVIPINKLFSRKDGYYWPQCECDIDKLSETLSWCVSNTSTIEEMKSDARKYALQNLSYKDNFEALFELMEQVTFNQISLNLCDRINSYDNFGFKRFQKLFLKLYPLYNIFKR